LVGLVVDSNSEDRETLIDLLKQTEHFEEVFGTDNIVEGVKYFTKNKIDILFVDIMEPKLQGIELAMECYKISSTTNIVLMANSEKYAMEAFNANVDAYVIKPIKQEDIKEKICVFRNKGKLPSDEHHVYIQTFGNFDVFVDGKLLEINRKKAKELLAYLVDRKGASVSVSEASGILWEEAPYDRNMKSRVNNVIAQLKKILCEAGIGDIIVRGWNSLALDVDKVECDYYELMAGNVVREKEFVGEYMQNYSWAESTTGFLEYERKDIPLFSVIADMYSGLYLLNLQTDAFTVVKSDGTRYNVGDYKETLNKRLSAERMNGVYYEMLMDFLDINNIKKRMYEHNEVVKKFFVEDKKGNRYFYGMAQTVVERDDDNNPVTVLLSYKKFDISEI